MKRREFLLSGAALSAGPGYSGPTTPSPIMVCDDRPGTQGRVIKDADEASVTLDPARKLVSVTVPPDSSGVSGDVFRALMRDTTAHFFEAITEWLFVMHDGWRIAGDVLRRTSLTYIDGDTREDLMCLNIVGHVPSTMAVEWSYEGGASGMSPWLGLRQEPAIFGGTVGRQDFLIPFERGRTLRVSAGESVFWLETSTLNAPWTVALHAMVPA